MKNINIRTLLILILFSFSAGRFSAEGAWWEKGAGVIKALTDGGTSGEPSNSEIGTAFKEAHRFGAGYRTVGTNQWL